MRSVLSVITDVQALLPNPAPPEIANNMVTLQAELAILQRFALYNPVEATELWNRLAAILYRYMPNVGAYPWAKEISTLVMGS